LRSPIWTGSRLLAADGEYYNAARYEIYDATVPGTRTELLRVPAGPAATVPSVSMAWTGTRVVFTNGSAIYSFEDPGPPPVTWQMWLAQHFPGANDPVVTAPQADPDSDGWVNLIEYATGSNPAQRASSPDISATTGSGGVILEWKMPSAHRGAALRAEVSGDLIAWHEAIGTMHEGGEIVTMRYVSPPAPKYFFRLTATLLP
jgi:hypothetical protein